MCTRKTTAKYTSNWEIQIQINNKDAHEAIIERICDREIEKLTAQIVRMDIAIQMTRLQKKKIQNGNPR